MRMDALAQLRSTACRSPRIWKLPCFDDAFTGRDPLSSVVPKVNFLIGYHPISSRTWLLRRLQSINVKTIKGFACPFRSHLPPSVAKPPLPSFPMLLKSKFSMVLLALALAPLIDAAQFHSKHRNREAFVLNDRYLTRGDASNDPLSCILNLQNLGNDLLGAEEVCIYFLTHCTINIQCCAVRLRDLH